MTRTAVGLLAAAIALGAGGRAAATIIKATYTGTVAYGADGEGLFGAPGADLGGDAYVATFTINTANGVYIDQLPVDDEFYGGAYYGDSSPVSATLEINGYTQSLDGLFLSYAEDETDTNDTAAGVEDYSVNGNLGTQDVLYIVASGVSDASILDSLSLSTTFNNGEALFGVYDLNARQYVDETLMEFSSPGTAEISGVPEPATWAMMLVGVGVLGAVMRGARARAAIVVE